MNLLSWFVDEWRMILDILNICESHPPRSFGLLYVSLAVLIFQNILAFQYCFHNLSHVLCIFCQWIFKNNCPGGGVLAQFFCPRVPLSL